MELLLPLLVSNHKAGLFALLNQACKHSNTWYIFVLSLLLLLTVHYCVSYFSHLVVNPGALVSPVSCTH
jgi:hypothetical protein